MVRDKYDHHDVGELKLRLLSNRLTDGRQNNLPSCSEVAALLVDQTSNEESHRDIIVEHKTTGLRRITELHPSFMALQYPLLFPYGEDGYRIGISHRNPETGSCYRRKTVTMRQYYSFRLQQRAGKAQTLLRSGRLFQQYMVDAYASIEEVRINWIRKNQKQLRAELYNGLRDAINQGDVMTNSVGRMTILPSSYTGGPRYRVQNYQKYNFFLETVEGQKSEDIPDIISRVFSIKLWELINDIKRQQIFGKVTTDKIQTPSKIDDTISAEIPDKDIDPLTFSAVERFMIHGPCGILNKKSLCMVNGKCGKHYPKRFHDKTSIDEDGFPIYMRRNGGRYILKNGSQLDSRYVVPYNRHLLIKYDAHINFELCNRSRSIKYLFKYINKGPDRVRAVISNVENFDNSSTSSMHFRDEIKEYLDCRYISPSEASWRIFKFNMFFREPAVERLSFHLHGQQTIYFPESIRISTILNREGIETTMQRRLLNFPDLHLSDDQLKNYALSEIQKHLRKVGKSLEDYKGMAIPNSNVIEELNNRLITEELNYDMLKMHEEYSQLLHGLNSDQKAIHDFVLQSITLNFGKLFFVYGSGGTGKTYLWRTLLAKLRSEGKIALAVATSGVVALLLPGGRTAHCRFQLPLNPNEASTCSINKGTHGQQILL
ncbi:uncharacterized protein [Cicer arietinum]